MILYHFSATCGDDLIADRIIQSFSTKNYLDGYPRDVDCWWNITSQSANEIIWVRTVKTENVEVTFESPVCFYFSVGIFYFFSSALLVMLKTDEITKSKNVIQICVWASHQCTFLRVNGKGNDKGTDSKVIIFPKE